MRSLPIVCGSIQFHKNCKLKPSLIWKDIGFDPCRGWIRFCMSGWTTTKIKQGLEILTGGFSHQAVMRTQMSLLLSTSWRRQPWIITYLPTESVFNTAMWSTSVFRYLWIWVEKDKVLSQLLMNSHHLSDTEGVAEVVEGVVPEVGVSWNSLRLG